VADVVTYAVHGRIAHVTINRPAKLNALNPAIALGLEAAWRRFEASDELCAVLSGAGDRAFSVGADLRDNPLDLWRGVPDLGVQLSKPVIGALHGHVIGGAFVVAMHCDLLVAAEDTVFSYPEVAVGFTGGIVAGLAARIPHKIAMEFMLLGERLDARRAYEVGMVNRVVAVGEHVAVATEWAARIAAGAPLVTAALKEFVRATTPVSPSELTARTRRVLLGVHTSEDRFEGERAFAEKRSPDYRGR
jgi:enoyl-CoA hydratase